jgi:hypothetical protein
MPEPLVVETWRGEVTIDELRAHWGDLFRDDDVMKIRRTLVDLRSADRPVIVSGFGPSRARVLAPTGRLRG